MKTLKNILGRPEFVEGVGDIYPVKIKDYDEFLECSYVLNYSKAYFSDEVKDYPLLDLIILGIRGEQIINCFERLFCLVLRKDVYFVSTKEVYGFIIDEDRGIGSHNYDQVRDVIMKQNIIHEPKVFKNPLVQQWAEKVMRARAKNSIKMTIEDMLTTVSVFKGVTYDVLAEQTYYQLYADFQRITKLKSYDTSISFKCAGATDVEIEHFAEEINLYKNPYDDLFVDSGKLNDINKALK